jgi:lipopolysaccharide export system protein LptA
MVRKYLRMAIAAFVVIFAAAVVLSLRHARKPVPAVAPPAGDPKALVQTTGHGKYDRYEGKVLKLHIEFGSEATYPDNRSIFGNGVYMELPDRSGRTVKVHCQESEVTTPPGHALGHADLKGGVTLETSDGVTVKAAEASYDDTTGVAQIPGPLTFSKGRMSGSGVGGTYDRTHELLTILNRAAVEVAADAKGGGATHVTSNSAMMARLDHYMKFTGNATFDGEGRVTTADEATAYLTADNDKVQRMELRGNAAIAAKPGESGPQGMHARDIDMTYAPDGRTLQTAHMVENAALMLPGDPGKPGRRVAGRVIDLALAPDGTTVTNITANDSVQVDLPPEGDLPARQIRSASLAGTGTAASGIQSATFAGGVDYRETRAARGTVEAIDRTARSERMDVKTKPGFGDIEEADFHANVRFTNGTDTTADAPTAIYVIAADRLDLSAATGDTGRGPHVSDGRVTVDAANIHMTLGAQTMKADTNVRSLMQQTTDQKPGPRGSTAAGTPAPTQSVRIPSMLKQDQPVDVKSNRLDYDAGKSLALYSGNARLWQEDQNGTVIQADRIVLEDKTGNLHATTNVVSVMTLQEASADEQPSKPAKPPAPTTTKADDLVYADAQHQATYTGKVHMSGPDGDVTADRIDLFLTGDGGQLERAEANAASCPEDHLDACVVSRQPGHRAYGTHLTYVAKDGLYTMVGSPVQMYDDAPPNCKLTKATRLTFDRSGDRSTAAGNGTSPQQTVAIPCAGGG